MLSKRKWIVQGDKCFIRASPAASGSYSWKHCRWRKDNKYGSPLCGFLASTARRACRFWLIKWSGSSLALFLSLHVGLEVSALNWRGKFFLPPLNFVCFHHHERKRRTKSFYKELRTFRRLRNSTRTHGHARRPPKKTFDARAYILYVIMVHPPAGGCRWKKVVKNNLE